LKREYERAVRHARPFAVLMIDADGLKPTNDQHGHAAGDRLLTAIAEVLKTALRGTDNCARYGGDEFIALLPEADAITALDAAERIRTGVAHTSFDFGGQRVQCTVSVGIASFPADAATLDDLLAAADRALYRAKNEGRNRIVMAQPATPVAVAKTNPEPRVTVPMARR
jgi:diguanylate cyclase (GGDEF)-like protein